MGNKQSKRSLRTGRISHAERTRLYWDQVSDISFETREEPAASNPPPVARRACASSHGQPTPPAPAPIKDQQILLKRLVGSGKWDEARAPADLLRQVLLRQPSVSKDVELLELLAAVYTHVNEVVLAEESRLLLIAHNQARPDCRKDLVQNYQDLGKLYYHAHSHPHHYLRAYECFAHARRLDRANLYSAYILGTLLLKKELIHQRYSSDGNQDLRIQVQVAWDARNFLDGVFERNPHAFSEFKDGPIEIAKAYIWTGEKEKAEQYLMDNFKAPGQVYSRAILRIINKVSRKFSELQQARKDEHLLSARRVSVFDTARPAPRKPKPTPDFKRPPLSPIQNSRLVLR